MHAILSDRIIGSAVHDVQKHLRFLPDNMGWLGSKDGTAAEQIRKMDLRLRCLPEWRYKTNALNAMLNNYDPKYLPVIKKVCQDEYCEVRDMAEWVLEEIERKGIGESENGQ